MHKCNIVYFISVNILVRRGSDVHNTVVFSSYRCRKLFFKRFFCVFEHFWYIVSRYVVVLKNDAKSYGNVKIEVDSMKRK